MGNIWNCDECGHRWIEVRRGPNGEHLSAPPCPKCKATNVWEEM